MEGSCSTGQSPQWAVVPLEEEDSVLRSLYMGKNNRWLMHANELRLVQWFRTLSSLRNPS
jgi:hypothetical protein